MITITKTTQNNLIVYLGNLLPQLNGKEIAVGHISEGMPIRFRLADLGDRKTNKVYRCNANRMPFFGFSIPSRHEWSVGKYTYDIETDKNGYEWYVLVSEGEHSEQEW